MKILFMGRKKYAAEMLKWTLEMKQEVVAVVTDNQFINSPTMIMANKFGLPVISLEQAEQLFRKNKNYADLVVSYLFWRRIKEPLISAPKYGCINFHPAILPDWKGVAGYNIAILNKLSQWGASSHYVDENIDTGKIIRVFKFSFDYRYETARSLEEKTQKIQCDLYKSVLTDVIRNGRITHGLQENKDGVYISKKEMFNLMKIKPENDDVELKCHAFWFPPYHGAYIEINGKKYTLVDDYILSQLKDEDQTVIQ